MTVLAFSFLLSLLFGQLPSLFPVLRIPVYVHDVVLVVLLLAGFLKIVASRRFTVPQLSKPIVTFVLVAGISLLANLNRLTSSQVFIASLYLWRWVAYMLIYVLVVQKFVSPKLWLKGLFWVGTGFALLGLVQLGLYPALANLRYLGWDPYYFRLFSTLFDPNFAGIVITLTFLLGLSFKRSGLILVAQAVNGLALFLTFSRSSYLAFLAGLVVCAILKRSWKLVFGFLAVVIVFQLIPKPGLEAFRLTREVSSLARLSNWQESFNLFTKAPILGFGFNTLKFVSGGFHQALPAASNRAGAGVDASLLFLLDTTGVLGFGAFGWLAYKVCQIGLKLQKRKATQSFGTVFLATLVALAVHSLFTNSVFYPWVMIWLWILIGVAESSQAHST